MSSESGKRATDVFDKLYLVVQQSEREIGKYGGQNHHGYLLKPLVVGKYASSSGARASLSAMSTPTNQQMKDMATLNMLPEYIVNAYCLGDVVLIAMNQPTNICIGHQDFLFEQGIPLAAFFFYCRGFNSLHGKTVSNETMLLATDLRSAILSISQRVNQAPQGRNKIKVDHALTASQSSMQWSKFVGIVPIFGKFSRN
ncbi:hypothetical protein DAPPUDRAFT_266994 [Daphnia pulex]|uniref:Uncharacterized protein n=1 Tax=Daphnia pulex TaxID=6669 RepID=E9HVV1_DAPPU|nr:hypothetical protein DAPPUDRAFT_266994 [Daphnia pulex]|eukprot:EFX64130.1 hypothetical protein DAPPUDRAFT_266994 [Daphnia pulex]